MPSKMKGYKVGDTAWVLQHGEELIESRITAVTEDGAPVSLYFVDEEGRGITTIVLKRGELIFGDKAEALRSLIHSLKGEISRLGVVLAGNQALLSELMSGER